MNPSSVPNNGYQKLESAALEVLGSQYGQALLKENSETYSTPLRIMATGKTGDDAATFNPGTNTIGINSNVNYYVQTTKSGTGYERANLQDFVTHELGHGDKAHTLDNGLNQMNNINTHENVWRQSKGEPNRTSYLWQVVSVP